MLKNQDLYNDLIGYLGNEPGTGPADEDLRILQAINAAMQDVYTSGPEFVRETRVALRFAQPQTVTFGATQGSTATTGTPFAASMVGCTIRINGEDVDNEIVSPTSVLVPILQGSSSNFSGTVYFDSAQLPPNVIKVSGNVFIDDTPRELKPFQFKENQLWKQYPIWMWDPYCTNRASLIVRSRPAYPVGYWVEPMQANSPASLFSLRLRIWPVPEQPHVVKLIAETSAPQLVLTDLEIGSPTPANILPIPGGLHETVLLPLARFRLSSYPHFLPTKRELVIAEGQTALDNLRKIRPQQQSGATLRPPYFLPR
jgi:hypothetical protein